MGFLFRSSSSSLLKCFAGSTCFGRFINAWKLCASNGTARELIKLLAEGRVQGLVWFSACSQLGRCGEVLVGTECGIPHAIPRRRWNPGIVAMRVYLQRFCRTALASGVFPMNRRSLLKLGGLFAVTLPALAFQEEKSKLKITGVRLVRTRPKRPVPSYTPAPGSWSTQGVEVANPMSIYPQYKATRSLWNPDPGKLEGFTVGNLHRQRRDRLWIRRGRWRCGGGAAPGEAAGG